MRKQEVERWIDTLTASFGRCKVPIDEKLLSEAWERGDISEMVSIIKRHLGITSSLRLGLVNSGMGDIPAWVMMSNQASLFGNIGLNRVTTTIYLRRSFIQKSGFEGTVVAIAHEMSHIVLNSLAHPLRMQEEAVDLTAMLLGFRDFYVTGTSLTEVNTNHYTIVHLGYLTREEISYASEYMTFRSSHH